MSTVRALATLAVIGFALALGVWDAWRHVWGWMH